MGMLSARGLVPGLAVVVVAAGFVGSADPEQLQRVETDVVFLRSGALAGYSNREYALDALALPYLQDFTDDATLIRDTASMYWCWTPVVEQWDRIPEAEKSEVALRARAKRLVARYAQAKI